MAKWKNQKILHLVLLLTTLVMSRTITCKLKKVVGFFDKRKKRKGESIGGQIAHYFWVGESLREMKEMRWTLFILLVYSKDKVFIWGRVGSTESFIVNHRGHLARLHNCGRNRSTIAIFMWLSSV